MNLLEMVTEMGTGTSPERWLIAGIEFGDDKKRMSDI